MEPIETVDRAKGVNSPMRLSYFNGNHYDSIVGPGFDEALLTLKPGVVESAHGITVEGTQKELEFDEKQGKEMKRSGKECIKVKTIPKGWYRLHNADQSAWHLAWQQEEGKPELELFKRMSARMSGKAGVRYQAVWYKERQTGVYMEKAQDTQPRGGWSRWIVRDLEGEGYDSLEKLQLKSKIQKDGKLMLTPKDDEAVKARKKKVRRVTWKEQC